MNKIGVKFLLAAFVLSAVRGGIAYSAQTINGKALGTVDDVVKEVNRGDLSLPKKGLITLRGGDKIGDVDIFATTFGADASSSTRRIYHNSNATQRLNWTANSPYYLRPAVSRRLYNGKRALMTHNLAPNGQLKYYFKTLSNTRSENSTDTSTSALTNSVQISDFGEYTTATFSNVENYHVMEVYGTGVMSVKGYDREIFVGASGAARSLTTHQNGGYQRVYRNDNEVRLEFFALNADSEGNMSQTPLTELTHETPYRGDPSLAIISLAVGDIDGDKYDNEVVLMITTLNEIRFFVYRLTFSDGKLTLRSLGDASGRLVHATDQWGDDLESQPVTDMAVGDFDGDGRDEIAVIFKFSERATALANDKGWKRGPMTGSVHCRVFQWNTTKKAFDVAGTIQNYNKEELVDSATNIMPSAKVAGVVGLRATAADLDGDGKDEIVTLLLGYYHSKSWDSKMNPICVRIDDFYVFPHLAVWTFNRGSIKPVHDDAHIMGGGKVMSANGKTNLYDFSWLYQHSSNKNGLLLSDTEPFLQYGRSWQRIIFPFPMDPTESVTGTNPDSITHMYALVDFSI
ncbi:MAG: hypothetical protein IJF90_01845, partial [Synergistaceae bacterium]|nr:hypothetical protein [Synergistaceae bacterium]